MWKTLRNYVGQALTSDLAKKRPLLAIYYLTYACDMRCPYCCDGSGRPYWSLDSTTLSGPEVVRLLKILRRSTDYLVLTGGEPLQYSELPYVLERLPSLRFDGVVFTTNGFGIEPHLEALSSAVRYLVFSIDTLDRDKADRWFGRGAGVLDRVLAGVEQARTVQKKRFEIIISAVATPENLEDLYHVYEYSAERGFRFALCPALQGVKPHLDLRENEEYRRLFDFLIAEKKKGRGVNGTVLYLKHMRDLTKFDCRPSTTLAVSPTGDVFYPCLEIGHVAGNLLQEEDLNHIRREAISRFGPEPDCDNRCQSACALGFSLILSHPASMIRELGYLCKGKLKRNP